MRSQHFPQQLAQGRFLRGCAGQALVEFTLVGTMLILLVFGLVDFGRAILIRQILVNVSREAANLSSRATSPADAAAAVQASAAPLNMASKGYIIITAVARGAGGALTISSQLKTGTVTRASAVGNTVGGPAVLPATAVEVPPRNQTLFVVEVFHQYTPVTPLGKLLGLALPSVLSDVAYF